MYNNLPKVSPNSMTARIFIAFLSSAGLFYINIMPTIVSGLKEALGFTNQQAGNVASANMYGAAVGALLIVFLVKKLNWQLVSTLILSGLIAIDLLSMKITDPVTLMAVRFGHGFIGGMLVGLGFSLIARTHQPDRTFGVLLFVQFGLGGLGDITGDERGLTAGCLNQRHRFLSARLVDIGNDNLSPLAGKGAG